MKLLRHRDLLGQIGLFLLGFGGSVYVSLIPANSMMNWYSIDDAFYYYQVARNALNGYGFTFDQINLTNGFHPLWMVVCLGVFWLSRFNLLLPLRVLVLVSGIVNGLTGVVLYRLLRKELHPAAAIVGACTWMLLPSIFSTTAMHGMEAAISALFLALFLSQSAKLLTANPDNSQRRRYLLLAGLMGALAILSRLDNLFVVFAVGMFIVLRVRRINRLLVFDLAAILVAAAGAWVIRFGNASSINNFSIYPMLAVGLVIKPVILFFAGFYTPRAKLPVYMGLVRFAICGFIFFALDYGILVLLQRIGFNFLIARSVILLDVALSTLLIAMVHYFLHPRSVEQRTLLNELQTWLKTKFKGVFVEGIAYSIPIALLIGTYMLVNRLMFGTFSPVSGQIKLWWGALTRTVYTHNASLVEVIGFSPNSGYGPWSLLTSLVSDAAIFLRNLFGPDSHQVPTLLFLVMCSGIFFLLVFLLSRKNGYLARKSFNLMIPALILGCFLQITYYTGRGYVHTRGWYWVAEMLVLVLLGSVLSSHLFEKFRQWTRTELVNQLLTFLFVVSVLLLHSFYLFRVMPARVAPENAAAYLDGVRKLEEHTNENSLIGMTGGGNTAYFIENRTIVNLDGLINSAEYFKALKNGTATQFLEKMKLDYVYGKPYILQETQPYDAIFKNRLVEIGAIRSLEKFTLFKFLR